MPKRRKILIIILAIILVLALALGILTQGTFHNIPDELPEKEYSDIMKQAYDANRNFGNTKITKIAMLGSHDSLSYNINYNSKPNTSEEDNIVNNGLVYSTCRGFIYRLSRAQKDDLTTQLKYGVRYLDVRITNVDGVFYTAHGLISNELSDELVQLLTFLENNPGEFVIFNIQHYHKGSSSDLELDQFMESIKVNGKSIFDYVNYDTSVTDVSSLTYNDMTAGGTKAGVIIIADQGETSYSEYFRISQSAAITSVWHNKIDSDVLIDCINAQAEKADSSTLQINQAQTTPSLSEPLTVITSWSLLDKAKEHNSYLLENENFDKWLNAMPIYMCDYATSSYNGFNTKINEKILERNKSL